MTEEPEDLDAFLREELPRIIATVRGSRVRELELDSGHARLEIKRLEPDGERAAASPSPVSGGDEAASNETGPSVRAVTSPTVGTFYHSEQPGRAALVQEGSRVERGALIGVIEALQVLTEVESDAAGTVRRVVAGDGQPVEYGEPLVEVLVDG